MLLQRGLTAPIPLRTVCGHSRAAAEPLSMVLRFDRGPLMMITSHLVFWGTPGQLRAGFSVRFGQELPGGDAAAAVFILADLNAILYRFGNRGYRAVQLEAGIIGGKLYLGAYSLRLGATGLTFFDDDVTNFFSPHAAGKSAIFLVAIGKGVKAGAAAYEGHT